MGKIFVSRKNACECILCPYNAAGGEVHEVVLRSEVEVIQLIAYSGGSVWVSPHQKLMRIEQLMILRFCGVSAQIFLKV